MERIVFWLKIPLKFIYKNNNNGKNNVIYFDPKGSQ